MYTSRSGEKSLIQPSIILGLGIFGEDVLDDPDYGLTKRWELHQQFQTPNINLLTQSVSYVNLIDLDEIENQLADFSVVQIRDWFLEEKNLVKVASRIRNAYAKVSTHASQPEASLIEPQILVIGATWEPVSAALLWPVAQLVRCLFSPEIHYQLLGVFVSANYNSSSQVEGNALTFVTLQEGELFLKNHNLLDWQIKISKLFPQNHNIPRHLYDQIFLCDALKPNNTYTQIHNLVNEVVPYTSALVESIVYATIHKKIDQDLLDDYRLPDKHDYIGLGISTVTVPLKQILALVRNYTVGTLIGERIFPEILMEHIRTLHEQGNQIGVGLDRFINQEIWWQFENYFYEEAQTGIRVTIEGNEEVNIYFILQKTAVNNEVPLIDIRAKNPFSSDQVLHVETVRKRLMAEIEARHVILNELNEKFDSLIEKIQNRLNSGIGQIINSLLDEGDTGLNRAEEVLSEFVQVIQWRIQELERRTLQIESSRQFRQQQDQVEGLQRWYLEVNRLRRVIQLKPRILSLILRGAILTVLLFQFFWSGIEQTVYFWPITLERAQFLQLWLQSRWEWGLFGFITLGVLTLISFFALMPNLGLWLILQLHRSSLANLFRRELEILVLEKQTELLQSQVLTNFEEKLARLRQVRNELQQYAKNCLVDEGQGIVDLYYLEYMVVDPKDVATIVQRHVVAQLTLQKSKRIIPSWREIAIQIESNDRRSSHEEYRSIWNDSPTSNKLLSQEIGEHLQLVVNPAVEKVVIKPADVYLKPEDYNEWFKRLWHGASPWLQIKQGTLEESALDINLLAFNGKDSNRFSEYIQYELPNCHLQRWFDPYRISLIRVLGGANIKQLARYSQFQQAFQLLSNNQQRQLTNNNALLVLFPSVVSLPELDDEETAQSENETEIRTDLTEQGSNLDSIISLFNEAINQLPDEYDGQKEVLQRILLPLTEMTQQTNSNISKKHLIEALAEMDGSYTNWPDVIKQALSEPRRHLDIFLNNQGIEPVEPISGEIYDANEHGTVVEHREDENMEEGVVVQCIRRGYMDMESGVLLKEPLVIVSKKTSS